MKNLYWFNSNTDIVVSMPGKTRLLSCNKHTMNTLHKYYLTDMLITWLALPIISSGTSTLHDLYFKMQMSLLYEIVTAATEELYSTGL